MQQKNEMIVFLLVGVLLGCTIAAAIVSVPEYAPALEWSRTYGTIKDWPPAFIEHASDGGYISGCTSAGTIQNPQTHCLVTKTGAAGYAQWNRTYSGPSESGAAHAQQTSDGGYIVTGWTKRSVSGSWDTYAWLIKTSESGLPEWNRTYGPKYGTISYSLASYAEQTADGGYILAGTSWVPAMQAFWLAKTDSSGNLQWNRTYLDGMALFVHQVEDGGFVVAGQGGWSSDVTQYSYLLKTDSTGNMIWNYTYNQGLDIHVSSAAGTSDGGYVIAVNTGSSEPSGGAFVVVKTDGNGTLQWQHRYAGDWNQACYGLLQTSDGGYILVGETSKPNYGSRYPLVIKTDESGTVQWMKRTWENGALWASADSVAQSSDGGYVIAGSFSVNYVAYLWIAKLTPSLSYQAAPALVFVSLIVAAVLESAALVGLIAAMTSSAARHRTSRSVTHS